MEREAAAPPGGRRSADAPNAAWPGWAHALAGLAVCGVALGLWGHTLTYFFVLEDGYYLVDAQGSLDTWRSFLDVGWIINRVHVRPLMILALRAEYAVFGFNPLPFHLFHAALYVVTCVVVGAWWRDRGAGPAATWLAVAAFAWHPAQWPWHALAHQGTSYFAMVGTLLILWGGHRLLEGGGRRDVWMVVGGFVLGMVTSEYSFSAAVALGTVALLRRDWRALRALWPLWGLVGVYAALRVYLLLTIPTANNLNWLVYGGDVRQYSHYLPKVMAYIILALPLSNAWVLGAGHDMYARTGTYGAIAGVVLCALLVVRWRRRGGTPARVPMIDLAGVQALACLAILCLPPAVHFGRELHPAMGLTLALVWAVAPLVRRPSGLILCGLLLAANSTVAVRALRAGKYFTLPVTQLQARGATHVATYQAALAQYPGVDAVYVYGIPPTDFLLSLLEGATPPARQWIADPTTPKPFYNAAVFVMTGQDAFRMVGVVHSPEELLTLLVRLNLALRGAT